MGKSFLARQRALLLITPFLAFTGAQAQLISDDLRVQAEALRDAAMRDTIAYELVESLTMEVGPRSAGSAGDKAAVAWAVQMLQGLGFENVRTEDVVVPHWDRGSLSTKMSAPYAQQFVATSLGGSPGTNGDTISAEVLRVESLVELRALSNDELEGNVVFIDHVMQRAIDGGGYSAASRIRSCAHYIAAERGAAATLIRSAGTSRHRVPHTGSMLNNDIPPTIPAIALANADADILTYAVQSDEPVVVQLNSTAQHHAKEISANVIGEIPGQGALADEIVLLGAHLDSWDLGTGAIDDGSGVAIVTAAARMILESGNAPRRTIRVVLFANEEFGLDGAEQYNEDHADTIEKHIVGLEADSGAGRNWRLRSQVAESALDLVAEIHSLLEPIGLELGNNKASGGADLSPMRKVGMPVLSLTHDSTYYFDYHHTPDDTLDKIDRDDLNQNVAAYVTATYIAANIDQDFGRLAPYALPERTCSAEHDTWPPK
ncbi:MAG: M20/M25/M40 family metallo-hydrolase [Woeseiaceae bacterium]